MSENRWNITIAARYPTALTFFLPSAGLTFSKRIPLSAGKSLAAFFTAIVANAVSAAMLSEGLDSAHTPVASTGTAVQVCFETHGANPYA